jgi:hypothetical protein
VAHCFLKPFARPNPFEGRSNLYTTSVLIPKASHAITLYYELIHSTGYNDRLRSPQKAISPGKVPAESSHSSGSSLNQAAGCFFECDLRMHETWTQKMNIE